MRMLLAGGAGFVGSHLAARLLEQGVHVVIVDNLLTGRRENLDRLRAGRHATALEVIEGDVCALPGIAGRIDAVLHLASPASPIDYLRHPIATLETGAAGTGNLLELARRHQARFLLASTSEVYGDPHVHPQPESYWGNVNPVGPRSVYDEAKRFAEALTMAYARHAGLTVRIARIFNTYGPGMRLEDGRVIPTFVAQALRGEPITVQGEGTQTRSYCYVDDLVTGLLALLRGDAEGPVNLGNPEEYSVLETAHLVLALTGSRSPILHTPLPQDDPRVRCPVIDRARAELGWEPRVPFRDGLARTVADLARRVRAGEAGPVTRPVPRPAPEPARRTPPAIGPRLAFGRRGLDDRSLPPTGTGGEAPGIR